MAMRNFIFLSLFVVCIGIIPSNKFRRRKGIFERPEEGRAAKRGENFRWPKGKVPYVLDKSYDEDDKEAIRAAMDEIEWHTCIQFVKRNPSNHDYLFIRNAGIYCESKVGRQRGRNDLFLPSDNCTDRGTLLHELMHALGFEHEHQRYDRDKYITVNTSALLKKDKYSLSNYEIIPKDKVDALNLQYAYRSVMHYTPYSGAASYEVPVIKPKGTVSIKALGRGLLIGYLTQLDIEKINVVYNCCVDGTKRVLC